MHAKAGTGLTRAAPTSLGAAELRPRAPHSLGPGPRHAVPGRVTPSPLFPGGSAATQAALTLARRPCLLRAPFLLVALPDAAGQPDPRQAEEAEQVGLHLLRGPGV